MEMVDAAGIDPATPTMSTEHSPAELRVRSGERVYSEGAARA